MMQSKNTGADQEQIGSWRGGGFGNTRGHTLFPKTSRNNGHSCEQPWYFRSQAFSGNSRRGLVSLFRSKRDERYPPDQALSAGHGCGQMGPRDFHFQRVWSTNPDGNGALRHDQDRSGCRGPRYSPISCGNGCHCEFNSRGPNSIGGRRNLPQERGSAAESLSGGNRKTVFYCCSAFFLAKAF